MSTPFEPSSSPRKPQSVSLYAVLSNCLWGAKRFYRVHSAVPAEAYLDNPKHREAVEQLADVAGVMAQARHIMTHLFRSSRIRAKATEGVDILFFGASQNEKKRFDFLEDLLSENLAGRATAKYDDLAFTPRNVAPSALRTYRLAITATLGFFRFKHGPVDALLLQKMQVYFSSYFRCLHSFLDAAPATVFVANDHSPAQTGCAAAARTLNLPVVYIQHAPVADYFPPLDFTLSILFNNNTVDAYARAGPIKGKHLITSEFHDSISLEDLNNDPPPPLRVGVFLPFSLDAEACRRVLRALSDNPSVGKILIKPHPAAAHAFDPGPCAKIAFAKGHDANAEIAAQIDVAVCCNSGVVLELLHENTPCFYVRDLDGFGFDLYGFVRASLIPERTEKALAGDFWRRTQEEKTAAAAAIKAYDPTCETPPERLHARLKREIIDIIAARDALS